MWRINGAWGFGLAVAREFAVAQVFRLGDLRCDDCGSGGDGPYILNSLRIDRPPFSGCVANKGLARGLLADGPVPGRKRTAQMRKDSIYRILYALWIR